MEVPVFVKCEPAWSSGSEESSNAEQLPSVKYEDVKVEPSTEEENSIFVKEEHLAQDVERDPVLEECDNDSEPPNQIQPVLHCADRHEIKCNRPLTCSNTEEQSSRHRENAAILSPSHSEAVALVSKVKYQDLLSCGKCGKSYSRPGHLVEFKNAGVLYCRQCHREFSKDSGEKLQLCKQCGKTFSDFSKFRRHELIHNREKIFICTQCDKVFRSKESLRTHMNSHTGDRPYKCSLCSKVYSRVWSLRRHTATHTGEKPYVCLTCGKVFAVRAYLTKHANTHSGIKAFSCKICGRAFSERSTLKTHSLTHTGEKPYSCSICEMAFVYRSTRRKHMLIHAKINTQ